ncbi:amidohydrolase [Nonomuraea soli]|uniref:Cytosine deaminase n=1 Tax=Nonomuraea soli TaxID=1032476 RepID=A0A7W0CFW8_9ACTN|nr:amidohydrolase [Nonomuraea soli]MBA2890415.1 cytosine deaminase [Nonomuraea soli]
MAELLLRDARLWGSPEPTDLYIRDGLVAPLTDAGPGTPVERLDGKLLLPGFVDAHAHVDKTMWGGPWLPHTSGPGLMGKIRGGVERRAEAGIPSADYIHSLLTNMIVSGTTHVRSHVDIDPYQGLAAVEAVREAVARLDGRITLDMVAFPQTGLLISPGTEELMDRALAEGVELVGGIDPAGLENDPVRHLDIVFGLAEKHGSGVDIHLHDRGDMGIWQYDLIIEQTRARGLGGKVTISHGYCLGEAAPAVQDRVIAALAETGIGLATVAPSISLPLKKLREAGVPVGAGNDGVRDLWSPYGTGDMLERTLFLAQRAGFVQDEDIEIALEAATYGGATLTGRRAGFAVGDAGDFVAVDTRNPAEAVCVRPVRSLVVKGGRVVAREGALV